jgi:hypothetical protein
MKNTEQDLKIVGWTGFFMLVFNIEILKFLKPVGHKGKKNVVSDSYRITNNITLRLKSAIV